MNIAIIGLGNMGGAIYQQLKNAIKSEQLFICDRSRPANLDTAVFFSTNADDVCQQADIIIFAVKPQSLDDLMASITVDLSKKIIISILAGTTIKKLQAVTGANKIIRAMPNLAAQVSFSVTGWVATKIVNAAEKTTVKKIFGCLGYELELKNEAMINKLTVLSGCGPAYFFYLCGLMEKASQRFGFSKDEASALVAMTLRGTAELLHQGKKTAATWRTAVTSKRGVTEAVLKHLKKKKFDTIFYQALDAGIKQSKELNK